jgi:hypothetical protein
MPVAPGIGVLAFRQCREDGRNYAAMLFADEKRWM